MGRKYWPQVESSMDKVVRRELPSVSIGFMSVKTVAKASKTEGRGLVDNERSELSIAAMRSSIGSFFREGIFKVFTGKNLHNCKKLEK